MSEKNSIILADRQKIIKNDSKIQRKYNIFMRVALINESFPPLIDGVSTVVVNYCKELAARGDTPIAVVPHTKDEVTDFPFPVLRFNSFYPHMKSLEYPVGNPLTPKLMKQVKKEDPQILHAHSPFVAAVIARMIRYNTGLPYVFTYHTRFELEFDKRLKDPISKSLIKKFCSNSIYAADEVWAVSRGCRKSLNDVGYKGDFIVMPNGTDFAKGRSSDADIKEIRDKYNIGDKLMFLYVGRVEWYKNIRLSLDSLVNLKKSFDDFKFVIVGKGIDLEKIKKYVAEVGLQDNVVFAGPIYDRAELRKYYSAADLLLFPSTFDTSGLVVKEAAACGVPSILIKDSCAAEDAIDGRNGFLCEENVGSMSRTLSDIVNSPECMKRVGKCAEDEIYCSFADVVDMARKRYEIVIENALKNEKERMHTLKKVEKKAVDFFSQPVRAGKAVINMVKNGFYSDREMRPESEDFFDLIEKHYDSTDAEENEKVTVPKDEE